jgi:hypothetical protein
MFPQSPNLLLGYILVLQGEPYFSQPRLPPVFVLEHQFGAYHLDSMRWINQGPYLANV